MRITEKMISKKVMKDNVINTLDLLIYIYKISKRERQRGRQGDRERERDCERWKERETGG